VKSLTADPSFAGRVFKIGSGDAENEGDILVITGLNVQSRWSAGTLRLDTTDPKFGALHVTGGAEFLWDGGSIISEGTGGRANIYVSANAKLNVESNVHNGELDAEIQLGNNPTGDKSVATMTLRNMNGNLKIAHSNAILVNENATLDFAQQNNSDTRGGIVPQHPGSYPEIINYGTVTRSVVDAAGKTFKLGIPIFQGATGNPRLEIRGAFEVTNSNNDEDWAVSAVDGTVRLHPGADLISSKKIILDCSADLVMVSQLNQSSSAAISADVFFSSLEAIVVGDLNQDNHFDTLTLKSLDMSQGRLHITAKGGPNNEQSDKLVITNNAHIHGPNTKVVVHTVTAPPAAASLYTFITAGTIQGGSAFSAIDGEGPHTPVMDYFELVPPADGKWKFKKK
jgi:hypothetical protein